MITSSVWQSTLINLKPSILVPVVVVLIKKQRNRMIRDFADRANGQKRATGTCNVLYYY
jgi:hypothetical protein